MKILANDSILREEMSAPLVSILMNGKDCEKYVAQAIDSVYAQSYTNWEIIFVDNWSTDGTQEILARYPSKLKIFKPPAPTTLGAARNYGLKNCTGKYIAFLDTDDLWHKDKLLEQVKLIGKGYALVYSSVEYIDSDGHFLKKFLCNYKSGDIFGELLKRYDIALVSVLIDREKFMELGEPLISESLRCAEDYEFAMRMAARYQIGVDSRILAQYRLHQKQLTDQEISRWGIEAKLVLDRIEQENPKIKESYIAQWPYAVAKIDYLNASYLIHQDKIWQARRLLFRHVFKSQQYFIAFFLSLMPKAVWTFVHKLKRRYA